MITIINISDTKFSFNGINYFKNFTPFVTGNKVSIVNTYDACISLTNFPTNYSDISVDGVTYGSISALQNALLPVLFNRTFSQSGSLGVGYIPKATGSNTLGNSSIYDNNGKIGIGTTSPAEKLDVDGNLNLRGGQIFSGSDGSNTFFANAVQHIFRAGSQGSYAEKMRITSGGNVLIGTTTDNGNKLQVNGTITATNIDAGQYVYKDSSGTSFISYYNGLPNNSSKSFLIYNAPDSPTAGGMWTVTMVKWFNDYGSMMAINCEPGSQNMYVKTVYGGSWSGWVQK